MGKRLLSGAMALAMALVIIGPVSRAAALSSQSDLETAIGAAAGPTTIALSADTTLSSTLIIPAGKDITLTGNAKLIGAAGANTITVNGRLTLDGITVTHNSGATGSGVMVNSGAVLTIVSGSISGNTSAVGVTPNGNGAGVFNSGTIVMSGGSISGNTSVNEAGGIFNNSGSVTLSGSAQISANSSARYGAGIYNLNGALLMNGGSISGNTATMGGAGVRNQGASATFTMNGGSISANTALGDTGAGVLNMAGATFTMTDGSISGNTNNSVSSGGGVTNQASTFTMSGGTINGNTAPSGGGVLNWSGASFTMTGGTISGNITTAANSRGGGVFSFGPATVVLDGGTISDHTTTLNGGGIYSTNGASLTLTSGTISGNIVTGDGGGVWIDDTANLDLSPDVVFSGNRANGAFAPDDDALGGMDNNFDINNTEGERIFFTVSYDGNGHTAGDVPVNDALYNPFDVVTVADPGDLARDAHGFLGWATHPDARAVVLAPGDTFEIEGHTTLYAIWAADEVDPGGPGEPNGPGESGGPQDPGGPGDPGRKPVPKPLGGLPEGKGPLPATGDVPALSALLIAALAGSGSGLLIRRVRRRR